MLLRIKVWQTNCFPPAFEFWTTAEVVNDVVKGAKIQIFLNVYAQKCGAKQIQNLAPFSTSLPTSAEECQKFKISPLHFQIKNVWVKLTLKLNLNSTKLRLIYVFTLQQIPKNHKQLTELRHGKLFSNVTCFGPNLNLCALDTNDRFSSCWVDHRSVNCLWWWMSSCAEKRTGDSVSFSLQEGNLRGADSESWGSSSFSLWSYPVYPRWSLPTMCDYHNFGIIFAGQCTVCLKG